ncbi:MAG: protease modulator HflC [Planctomycetota bacterium]
MKIQIILLALIGLVLLLAGMSYIACYVVNENEYVILTRFGKTVLTRDEPGLYFKRPGPLETVNRLDKRTHIFKSQPITLLLHDQNPIIVACFICWKISDPGLFFQRVKTVENASQKISDMINSQLGSVIGNYDLDNIINMKAEEVKLDDIETRVCKNTEQSARDQYGIHIVRMGIRRLAYPAIVENSVYSRMRAEREKEARKFRAEGSEEAAKIEAQTDLEVKKIMAEAYKDAQIMKGNGDKEAMRIYAEAYGKDPEFYEFLKSLEIYKKTLRENTTLILSTDSELFKNLNYDTTQAKSSKEQDHE